MIYRVSIIGAGKIAAFYDTPQSEMILTHAHTISISEEFLLSGFYDTSKKQAIKAAKIWGGVAFDDIRMACEEADVVCICVPDKYHKDVLLEALKFNPRFLILEKPISNSLFEAKDIVELIKNKDIGCEVNYSRRFMPEFWELKDKIKGFGKLLGGTAYYGKGFKHNASHLINLFLFLFESLQVEYVNNYIVDYEDNDKSYDVMIRIDDAFVRFLPIDCTCVTIFEFDLLFESARVRYVAEDGCLYYYMIAESEVYKGELNYVLTQKKHINDGMALRNLYAHVKQYMDGEGGIVSSIEDAYRTLEICDVN